MKSLVTIACLLLLCISTTSYALQSNTIGIASKSFEIKAEVTPKFRSFKKGESKIEGKITITNLTSTAQRYGNKFLKLTVNEHLTARTYKDTIASEVIDITAIEIKPHSSLSLPVYWVFRIPKETEVNSLQLYFDDGSLEKSKGITRP
ncbi:hypothetical protein [Geomonas edaphica]|uniref:hypothetical protein n=1 Tax=Geomonas edaphica TaxID=2570226 RepID=UPI0010A83F09|nr:hypothetical protein [Geomonas edaphica]